jgi:predicted Rossmann fold flavoprotein
VSQEDAADLIVVGAGAAGLMAALWAARTHPTARVVLLDGATKIGAKILVAGGGRCNVTHHAVVASDFNGSSSNAIKKVLQRFSVKQTVEFFAELGVELKREPTGKLFPTTDRAQTVLDALLGAVTDAKVHLMHPWRVEKIESSTGGFVVRGPDGSISTRRLILATGGRSLPKTGSDGGGHRLVKELGHGLTERIYPALVPLKLADAHPLRDLSGLSVDDAVLSVHAGSGKCLHSVHHPVLCTHFGLSGPGVLDISRHWIAARFEDAAAWLSVNWFGQTPSNEVQTQLMQMGDQTVGGVLRQRLPKRLADSIAATAKVDPATNGHHLSAEQRKRLVREITAMRLDVSGDRGYTFAEVTAGGVPLDQIDLKTMASRRCPGLQLVGEICDVDGRIGGFNFQWAWASGYVAGTAPLSSL